MPGFPSQCCLAFGLLFTYRMILEVVFPKGSKSRRRGGPWQDLPPGSPMLGLISTPLLSPSPEKEGFKKRQKLQQDNGEETDENEVEEVSRLCARTEGRVWVWSIVAPRGRGTKPSLALQASWRGHGAKDSMLY